MKNRFVLALAVLLAASACTPIMIAGGVVTGTAKVAAGAVDLIL